MKQFFICRRCGALYEFADKVYRKAPWVPFLESGGLNCILKQVPSCDCWKGQAVEVEEPTTIRDGMKLYVVVRQTDDGPDLDLSASAWTRDRALEKAAKADAEAPRWAMARPILRVAVYELKEINP